MKKRLIIVTLAMVILLLITSCAAQQLSGTSDIPSVSVSPVSPLSASPESPPSPSVSPPLSEPPLMPEEERRYASMPCIIKLEPYVGGSYTDGVNSFIFKGDGTVLFNDAVSWTHGHVYTFEKKDIEKPLNEKALMETDDYKAACIKVAEHLGDEYPEKLFIAHKDGDTWCLYYDSPTGGGSGDSYWITDKTVFVKISADGQFADFGALKAAHIIWCKEHFYYVELVSGILGTPGIGKVMRVDIDGQNRKTIVNEPAYGTIQATGDRIYYTSLADGKAYSVDLDGKDKTPVSDRIVPVYHRVGIEFYGDAIISKYWNCSGYVYSYFTYPTDNIAPAIMDINEQNLITFPQEMSGDNGYEVINWGGDDSYFDESGSSRWGTYLVFLKSTYDGSYWVYEKWGFSDGSSMMFTGARKEWAAKAG